VLRASFSQSSSQNPASSTQNPAPRTQNPAPSTQNDARAGAGNDARELIDRAIAAKGGLERLRAIKSITAVTEAQMTAPEGTISAQTTTYLEYPDRMRVETKLPEGDIVQTFDGTRAWVKDRMGIHEIPERMIRDLKGTFKRDTVTALLAAHDGTLRARLLPDVKDSRGLRRRAVELSGSDLEPVVLNIDAETYLVSSQSYVAGGQGAPLVEEEFSDYKPVDGLQIAFAASVSQYGRKVLERRVTSIRINAPLNPSLFQRPSP